MNNVVQRAIFQAVIQAGWAQYALGTWYLKLLKAPFTPGPDLDFTGVPEADFGGYVKGTDVLPTVPAVLTDPANGDAVFNVPPADNGNVFQCTGAPLTNVIYGWVLDTGTSAPTTDWVCCALFDTPISVTLAGQFVQVPLIDLRALFGSIS